MANVLVVKKSLVYGLEFFILINLVSASSCDWKVEILLDNYIFDNGKDANWTVKVSKNYGEDTNISVRGYVKDVLSEWQKDYEPWTNETIADHRNQKYSPNLLENKFYIIYFNITELDCEDTNLENNFDYKFIMVLPQKLESDYTKLKINEIFPDPTGYDDAAMPEGEWVELYNSGDTALALENLNLRDNYGKEPDIFISDSNTIGGTIIAPKNYLVVYMNGRSNFLNNEGFEKIGLYKDDNLIDEVSYSGSKEGLTWSKIGDLWQLSKPSPSEENKNNETDVESYLEIEEIYDLGKDDKAEWGDLLRVKVLIYKGDTTKNSVKLYAEDNDERISKETKINVYEKFNNYSLTLPLQLGVNCDKKFKDGSYYIYLEGLDKEDSEKIKIEGFDEDVCKEEIIEVSKKEENAPKIKEEVLPLETNIQKEDVVEENNEVTTKTILNKEKEIVYESTSIKAKKSALYFLCGLLILIIIALMKDGRKNKD